MIKGVRHKKGCVSMLFEAFSSYSTEKNIQSKMGHFIKPIGLAFFPKIEDYVWETFCFQNMIKGVRHK